VVGDQRNDGRVDRVTDPPTDPPTHPPVDLAVDPSLAPAGDPGPVDPRDAAFFVRDDYYEVLARLRAEDPVHECAPGLWAVTRYEDIRDLSRDPHHFCSGRGALANDPIRESGQGMRAPSILHMDPPEHAAFRGLVNRRFTPRALSGLAESVRKTASGLLDAADAHGEIDFVSELAAPFPLAVIAELLGIDEADREDFRRWSDAAIESPDLPPDETMAALGELSGFIVEHIRTKRERPGDDLVSLLVESEVEGCPLSKDELFIFLLTLLVAGNETTRTLLSGTTVVLDQHPDQRARLVADADLVPGAVEECLRWVTPVHAFCRTATEDVEVAGTQVAEGDYLCMLYASGNRDERVFGDDASRFDVARRTNPVHLAFGFGEHVCLGASLARLEARIFLEELLARFPTYAVTGPAVRVLSTTVAGIRWLPVVLAPGPALSA
jgi:cytochrome P450